MGTRLGGSLRRRARERSLANRVEALSFAAYRAATDLFPAQVATIFDPFMQSLGLDPGDTTTDITTPSGVGNVASRAVLDCRHTDGSNQLGDEPGGSGLPYADYTGYVSVNDPMDLTASFDPTTVHDPSRWQPLRFVDATGTTVTQPFLGAQWGLVTPFAMSSGSQFRSSTGSARFGSPEYLQQAETLVDLSAHLTDEQKAITEYWADGPGSTTPPGHWNLFAQYVARRDRHGASERALDRDVKLFFALTNAIFDASICAWDNKRAFDSERPITSIRYLFRGNAIRAWGGPGLGTRSIDGANWLPYQAATFPTPPFPEFASGHSTFSAAGAEILKTFTGSDRFGLSATALAGSSRIEPGLTPASDVTFSWKTFSEAARQAGLSRRLGGIHFEQADEDGRAAGRRIARRAWDLATAYFGGTAGRLN